MWEHARVHSERVSQVENDFRYEPVSWRDLSEEQMRAMPHGMNSIAWLIWHMARTEDAAIAHFVGDGRQVLDEGWYERLGVSERHIGTAMTKEEAAALSAAVDMESLRGYRDAVGLRTRAIAQALPAAHWDVPVGEERLEAYRESGACPEKAPGLIEFYRGKRKGWFLSWVACGHNYAHLGQCALVRALLRRSG
jgi:hypothetical protein